MSDLTSIEKLKFEKLFGMGSGYVLDFSNRTFREFILENAGIDIFQSKYEYASNSKANRLRAFWNKEGNSIVGKLLLNLLEIMKVQRQLNNQMMTLSEIELFDECRVIANRLLQNTPADIQSDQDVDKHKKKDQQLAILFDMFEELAKPIDHQKRGYLLEELLNQLFIIYEIPVRKSFKRNEGGEQIDGAFLFQGWHYIVECKWTTQLSNIRELDSLLGKVNRSGRQAMGLFISIDGWSMNVPNLLKQNPDKCIILMDGYDLRCVLSRGIELDELLQGKLAKLNNETEPFCSVVELMKR